MPWISMDSAEVEDIKKGVEKGLDKVTTNPSLLKKAVDRRREKGEDIDIKGYLSDLCEILGPNRKISLEVVGLTADSMVRQARRLYEIFNPIAGNVWIKVPITTATEDDPERLFEGMNAMRTLIGEGIPINTTLIMRPEQAVIAGYLGATAVSPFVGRIDDFLAAKQDWDKEKAEYYPVKGKDGADDNGVVSGVDMVAHTTRFFWRKNILSKVLAASFRNLDQVKESKGVGADILTMPPAVYDEYMDAGKPIKEVELTENPDVAERMENIAKDPFDTDPELLKEVLTHPKTLRGVKKFYDDAMTVPEYLELIGE